MLGIAVAIVLFPFLFINLRRIMNKKSIEPNQNESNVEFCCCPHSDKDSLHNTPCERS